MVGAYAPMIPGRYSGKQIIPRRDGSIEGRNVWSVTRCYGFKAPKRAWGGELSRQKWRETSTPVFPSQRKRVLEVIRRRLKGVVRGEFIDSLHGIDELRNRWRSLEFGDTLSLHDVLIWVLHFGHPSRLSPSRGLLYQDGGSGERRTRGGLFRTRP